MKDLTALKQERAKINDQLADMLDVAKNDGERAFNEDESKQFDALELEIKGLDSEIEVVEKHLERQNKYAKKKDRAGKKSEINKMAESFSLIRAINGVRDGNLKGLELEIHQEGKSENRNAEGFAIPEKMMEARTMLTAGTAETAGNLIETNLGGFIIDKLVPNPIVQQMGATVMTGLIGNLDIVRETQASTSTWEGENTTNAETNQGFDLVKPRPKRLGAFTPISKTLLMQTGLSSELRVANSIRRANERAIDSAAINGSGVGEVPLGLLGHTIGDVALGTDGGNLTFANVVMLESLVAGEDAEIGNLAYLMTPELRGFLKTLKKDAGSGEFVWNNNLVNGYNARISNLVPKTLTKGANSDCHAFIYGNWADLLIARWGGVDIVVDVYTPAKEAAVEVVVNTWQDIKIMREASFAAVKDARIVTS